MGVLHIILKVGQLKFELIWTDTKQQWAIEEIFIFSNSSHLEWRAELSDTILKRTHPGTIPARLGLIWFSGFRGEDWTDGCQVMIKAHIAFGQLS
jgi:hypothetical protein